MEWNNKSKYNSFNSYKGLAYYNNYKQILKWLDGDKYLPPPIEVNLDPIAACNLDCYFCIGQRYLKHHREEIGEMTKLPILYMFNLVDFLFEWGVRGLCISGGGEPTLHEGLPHLMEYAKDKMDIALVSNATKVFPEILYCRWVALSVDAADKHTYQMIKGKDEFNEVKHNIEYLVSENTGSTDLCFKFLILPENQYHIYQACKLAKELGVQDFHARPVDFERKDIEGHKKPIFNLDSIKEQFELCHELEDDNFHVYTISHQFNDNLNVKHDFTRCLAAPVLLPILTDGNGYLCVEHKMEEKYRLGSAFSIPHKILGWWGSDKHRDMVKDIVPSKHCSRCIYCEYHKQVESVKNDTMYLNFP